MERENSSAVGGGAPPSAATFRSVTSSIEFSSSRGGLVSSPIFGNRLTEDTWNPGARRDEYVDGMVDGGGVEDVDVMPVAVASRWWKYFSRMGGGGCRGWMDVLCDALGT